jgi:hypothetical protein
MNPSTRMTMTTIVQSSCSRSNAFMVRTLDG